MSTHPRSRAAALFLACAASACSSSDRMVRISPLSGESSPDRVNLWPLLYSDSGSSSVVWPLFDVDERGFAVRPFFALDDATWSVLYPLSQFDADTGQGWFFPFYKTENYTGLFPLAHVGPFSWVGPVWWRPEQGTGGLFPLAYFGETFSYAGPVWWSGAPDAHLDGGLFPIATFGRFNYVTLFWWMEGFDAYGLFPLFGTGRTRHVGPFWWRRNDEKELSGGLFPLVHMDPPSGDWAFHPFYADYRDEGSRSRNVLLGLGHWRRAENARESWLFPLYYSDWERTDDGRVESDTTVLPLFWTRTRGEDKRTFTLLGHKTERPGSSSLAVYPLWWSGERTREPDDVSNAEPDEDTGAGTPTSWQMLIPFYYSSRTGDAHTLLTPLGGYGWDSSGQSRYVNVLGPLFHSSRSLDGSRESRALLWPFYQRTRDGDETTTRLLPLYSRTSSPQRSEAWYALGLGHAERRGRGEMHRFWPLYSHAETERPGFFYELTFFQSRESGATRSQQLFPLFANERSKDARELDVLLGLGNYRRRGGEKSWAVWPLASHSRGTSEPGLAYDLTLVGSARWNGGESFHVAGPLVWSDRSEEDADRRERKRRLFLLYTIDEHERLTGHVPRSDRLHPTNRIRHKEHAFLFGAFKNQRETFLTWRDDSIGWQDVDNLRAALAPEDTEVAAEHLDAARGFLTARGTHVPGGRSGLRSAVGDFVAAETVTTTTRHVRVPLLYGYKRSGDSVEQYGPLWIVQSKKEPGSSKFRFLYYVYRSETKADGRTSRDIFPFVTADTAPDSSKFTFLWHFLHYERDGDRRGGHVLFIPWGRL